MTARLRVVAVATHPIQYYSPWFRLLAAEPSIEFKVIYLRTLDAKRQGEGFGVQFQWDVDLLAGYESEVLSAERGLWGALRAAKPQVALLTGWQEPALIAAAVVARALGARVVVRGESNALRRRPLPVQLAHRALLRLYDRFLAIGKASREFYEGYGIAPSRIHDARYFVENARFERQAAELAPDRARWRAQFGIPEAATCFLFAGKLIPKKDPETFVHAIEQLARQGLTVHGLVAGDGELRGRLEAACLGRQVPVTFAGFLNQTEIGRAYAAADALVLPSDYGETWGLVVNEAMLFGLPAIVSDRVGCGPDLVEPNVTGLRFPFRDVAALTHCMKAMAADPVGRRRMGEAARERVKKDYSPEKTVAATLAALK
jgi:glycosyltransferase involved in cell wall biosynthesis